jgi:hypothetical protein
VDLLRQAPVVYSYMYLCNLQYVGCPADLSEGSGILRRALGIVTPLYCQLEPVKITLLHAVCCHDNVDLVRSVVEAPLPPDINVVGVSRSSWIYGRRVEFKFSAMDVAAMCGHSQVVEYLLNNGARITSETLKVCCIGLSDNNTSVTGSGLYILYVTVKSIEYLLNKCFIHKIYVIQRYTCYVSFDK